jgi:hypothetical protein
MAKQTKKERFIILSPDGFTIEFNKPYYRSFNEAYTAFIKWKERFQMQGYYSSNSGRIPLDELMDACTIKII